MADFHESRGGALVPAHVRGGQERVREAGLCGELSKDHREMCIREAGHAMPHGDGGAAWVPTKGQSGRSPRTVSVRLPDDTAASLKRVAALEGRTPAQAMEVAWKRWLHAHRDAVIADANRLIEEVRRA